MTDNEKVFVKTIVDLESNVKAAQSYIKENFNIDSEYDDEANTIKLTCPNVVEALNLISAKSYINEQFENTPITVVF